GGKGAPDDVPVADNQDPRRGLQDGAKSRWVATDVTHAASFEGMVERPFDRSQAFSRGGPEGRPREWSAVLAARDLEIHLEPRPPVSFVRKRGFDEPSAAGAERLRPMTVDGQLQAGIGQLPF